jgi:hypothetical protein
MHCSTDLTEERVAADADADGAWDAAGTGGGSDDGGTAAPEDAGSGEILADDGLIDDTLTVLVGLAGGVVVGVVGTVVLLALTASGLAAVFGPVAWVVSTAYLVRRRTVQEAVSRGAYAVAVVLLSVPLVAASPFVDVEGGVEGRVGGFLVLFVLVAVPAGIAAVVGAVASRFVPDR